MTDNSEYLKITEDDNNIVIGLKENAKDALGDVKFVDIVSSDTDLADGDMFASVEAKKAVVELESPFKGKITEINDDLEENPEKIYDNDAWIVKIKKM